MLVGGRQQRQFCICQYLIDYPTPITPGTATGSAVVERRSVHIPDLLAWPGYQRPDYQAVGRQRTVLSVPLLRDGVAVGLITLMRSEVRPFTDRQISLVETFADQPLHTCRHHPITAVGFAARQVSGRIPDNQ
jgi:GAF domain-containing protein